MQNLGGQTKSIMVFFEVAYYISDSLKNMHKERDSLSWWVSSTKGLAAILKNDLVIIA